MARKRTGDNVRAINGKLLGKRIKEIRLEKNISIQKLADGVGVQASFINQLEHGDKVPSFGTLIDILNTLQVSADELLYDYLDERPTYVIHNRIAAKLDRATEEQLRRIEAHIELELTL